MYKDGEAGEAAPKFRLVYILFLKMGGLKMKFPCGFRPVCRGELLVLGRVYVV